eukprot:SAG31_NODE_1367_length_8615_cov_12.875763_1_plen_62_part_00
MAAALPPALRAVLVGSGADGLGAAEITQQILRVAGTAKPPRVLYLGVRIRCCPPRSSVSAH